MSTGGLSNFTSVTAGGLVRLTQEGGLAVKLLNKSGAASVRGYVVEANDNTNRAVSLTQVDMPDAIGVFYESGVADGELAWVVISGLAYVYFVGSATRGQLARTFLTADGSFVAGNALAENFPAAPFLSDKHFCEIGHVLESRTGAGLALCALHFN